MNNNSCNKINFKLILNSTIAREDNLDDIAKISINERNREVKLLSECIKNGKSCIVSQDGHAFIWLENSKKKPSFNLPFKRVKKRLMFGVVQFLDKKTGLNVCIVARNTFISVIPWTAKAWVINGDRIEKYLISSPAFYHTMTPEILYQSLLNGYEQAKIDAIDEDKWFEENKKHQLLTVHGYKNTNIKQVDNLSATAISSKELFDPTMMAVGIAVNQIKSLQKTWF